ncbi:hypothetical protein JXM67_02885 [candidate division WOR-3 bacterium]|nr:hypothetical protein [candidate division WOR-3 bacterium]
MKLFGAFIIWGLLLASFPVRAGWVKSYDGGEKSELGVVVQHTADGGFATIGLSFDPVSVEGNIWLLRTDSEGKKLWEKNHGPVAGWNPCGQRTSDGGYILSGAARPLEDGACDIWLIKTDSEGDEVWTKTYGGPMNDAAESIEQTDDGGYVIVGFRDAIEIDDPTNADMWLLKLDPNGDTLWTKTYGVEEEPNYGKFVSQTSDGRYIIACQLNTPEDSTISILKTDALGDSVWTFKTYQAELNCVRQTSDEGYVATGIKIDNINLLKLDNDGELLWEKNYGDTDQNDGAYCVQEVENGNFVVTGFYNMYFSHSGINSQGWLLKIDPNGDTMWSRLYGSGGTSSDAHWIEQTSDGGYILTGGTQFSAKVGSDLVLIKTDSEGKVGVEEPVPATHSNDWQLLSPIGNEIVLRFEGRADGLHAEVFDAAGCKVNEIHSAASSVTLSWGKEQNPGVYFIKEISGTALPAQKVILVK